jgi:hypothetical protein
MAFVKLISSKGPGDEALLVVSGQPVCVVDELSWDIRTSPKPGDEFEFEFSNELAENESWEDLFGGNLDKRIGIEQVEGWEYLAFGKIISVDPVQVDCGLFIQPNVLHTQDPHVVGEFICFKILRLSGHAIWPLARRRGED